MPVSTLNVLLLQDTPLQNPTRKTVLLQAKEACYMKDAMVAVKGHLQAGQIQTAIEIINIHIQHL